MTKKQIVRLELDIAFNSWEEVKGLKQRLDRAAEATLSGLPQNLQAIAQKAQMTLLLTNDEAVQSLNCEFRDKDKPTNILSFPQFEPDDLDQMAQTDLSAQQAIYIGDLAAAYETTEREAQEQKKEFLDHVTHLVVHGILHVFGYDHITDEEAEEMEAFEQDIMAQLELPDPYADYED